MSPFAHGARTRRPIDFAELYSALQQGVVKAQENPPEIINTSKLYEVQKFMSLTAHANIPSQMVLGRAYWEKLPKDLQDAVMKAAAVSRDVQVRLSREANVKLVDELQKKGMTVVRDVDRKSFEAGADGILREVRGQDRQGPDQGGARGQVAPWRPFTRPCGSCCSPSSSRSS